jgi:dimethylargininase
MFHHAIVRPPATSFADGLTTANLGAPDVMRALLQHAGYCAALESLGLALTRLPEDPRFPDSTFVEDTAVVAEKVAVLTRPGAPSRAGETAAMRPLLESLDRPFFAIEAPGTVDGGDVCEADGRFLIGVSERTNEAGARALAEILARFGYTPELVDIRGIAGLLHFKTGVSYLGEGTYLAIGALAGHPALAGARVIAVSDEEACGANAIEVNGRVIIPSGLPRLADDLTSAGREVLALDMSEFQKMDGGLSCLSVRI